MAASVEIESFQEYQLYLKRLASKLDKMKGSALMQEDLIVSVLATAFLHGREMTLKGKVEVEV